MDIFVERLKLSRQAKNVKSKDIANHLEITQRAYLYYESGKREPNLATFAALVEYLDVSADYLLGRTDDPASPDS